MCGQKEDVTLAVRLRELSDELANPRVHVVEVAVAGGDDGPWDEGLVGLLDGEEGVEVVGKGGYGFGVGLGVLVQRPVDVVLLGRTR